MFAGSAVDEFFEVTPGLAIPTGRLELAPAALWHGSSLGARNCFA
jgi:hypothetical protein